MKTFLRKTLYLIIIPPLVFLIGMLLPPTPLAKEYLLASRPFKDSLLLHVKQPRIIFIAGSSMNFGLDSQVIKDSLHRNPINTGTHGGTGLFFMMDHNLPYVQKGDVVVLVAEYHQMYGNFAEGGEELLRVIFDNSEPSLFFKLRKSQLLKTYPYIPKYAMSKFLPAQYFKIKMNPVYSKNAYNQYGDAVTHWKTAYDKKVEPFKIIEGGDFNEDLLKALVEFNQKVLAKGAKLYVSFPPYQQTSFDNCKEQIAYIDGRLQKTNLEIIGTPERYVVADDMLYDTPYHLNKKGVDQRTRLLLEDVKAAMKKDGIK
ncbi:MAG TPA: hypothetical protein VK528_10440 [Flavobacterium sp.]|nr:hypothetical protein [Flavobacterium sp.]